MKSFKKVTAFVLAVMMTAAVTLLPVSAKEAHGAKNSYKNNDPMVLVHGMLGWGANEGINRAIPYWGATTGNAVDYLRGEGYDCYAASVGPLNSVWDQACELYAQLMGTRVDYGTAHSAEEGHKRFGRDYAAPLFEGWGQNGKKVHLVGHSFGGNAVRMLTYLLTYGCPEEMSACENPSALFEGGHEDLVASCTAICTPMNGTTAYNVAGSLRIIRLLKLFGTVWAGTFGRSVANGTVVDFHLEQFGVSAIPGDPQGKAEPFFTAVPKFADSLDAVDGGLSLKDCKALNDTIEISPNVYYFSVAYDCTVQTKRGTYYARNCDFVLLQLFSAMMLGKGTFYDEASGITVDESWLPNDGLVNVKSAQYPFDEPHTLYDAEHLQQGIWNVLPTRTGDHGTPIGLFADDAEAKGFFNELAKTVIATESE